MKYERIERDVFLERPTLFVAYAAICEKKGPLHVKNAGGYAELLASGAGVPVH